MNHIVPTLFAVLCLFGFCYGTTLVINATIYDHSNRLNPDFENTISTDRGIVQNLLGADRKPVYVQGSHKTVHNASTFNQWFRDTPGINMPIAYQMTLTKGRNNNIYTFSDSSFFPIDNKGFGNEGRSHNYHFCLELHSSFTYLGGEVFTFTGDDDVFVFINNQLQIDLGGIHSAQSKSVALDGIGLAKNHTYKFDLFFCERHTTQSNLQVQTTMKLYCEYTDRCGVCEGDGQTCPCTCDHRKINCQSIIRWNSTGYLLDQHWPSDGSSMIFQAKPTHLIAGPSLGTSKTIGTPLIRFPTDF